MFSTRQETRQIDHTEDGGRPYEEPQGNRKHQFGWRVQALLPHRSGAEALDPGGSRWLPFRRQLQQRDDHLRLRFCGACFELHAERLVRDQSLFAGPSGRYGESEGAIERRRTGKRWQGAGLENRDGEKRGAIVDETVHGLEKRLHMSHEGWEYADDW